MSSQVADGTVVWVKSSTREVYEIGKVVAVSDTLASVRKRNGGTETVNTKNEVLMRANQRVADDVTGLTFFHEAAILHNLEMRSTNCDVEGQATSSDPTGPYTRMGTSVLICVNPLQTIPDPEGALGSRKAANISHPYGIAEVALQQLTFAASRASANEGKVENPINQSIVVGGESGAGKTESSKMVLRHLVSRLSASDKDMDQRLLSANPILEALGNASTLRNHNSSRFGRFLKVHLDNSAGDYSIAGASLKTYLLERSRVTHHEYGERNFHVFYQFLGACADGKLDSSEYCISSTAPGDYGILSPHTEGGSSAKVDDAANFDALSNALEQSGVTSDERKTIFCVVSAILHIGNVAFESKETSEGDIAHIPASAESALVAAGKMLGLEPKTLGELFTQRIVKTVGETMVVGRTAEGATQSRDAFSRALYSNMFEWLVQRINANLGNLVNSGDNSVSSLPFIGVLDIFGFESFEHNDFEQLLINYANEALQGTFNRQIFQAELEMFQREGLMGATTPAQQQALAVMERMRESIMLNSLGCLELLQGSRERNIAGILKTVAAQGKVPQPSDSKMLQILQKTFGKNDHFKNPHPRERHEKFIISHYAGEVQYTVGNFLLKDSDRIPNEVESLIASTSDSGVKTLWDEGEAAAESGSSLHNVTSKFSIQMRQLVNTLEASRCSFIRCIKPNSLMMSPSEVKARKKDELKYFDRRYVSLQLKNLSIPQTAELLSHGFPTRVDFAHLVELYKPLLPADALSSWSNIDGADRSFVAALFFAFEIPTTSFKIGLTKVFFESGMMDKVNAALEAASDWGSKSSDEQQSIIARFKGFFARTRFRSTIAKVVAFTRFTSLMIEVRKENNAKKLQSVARMNAQKKQYLADRKDCVRVQSRYRARMAEKRLAALKAEAELKRLEEERRRQEEEALEKMRAAEQARKEAEEQKRLEEEARQREAAAKAALEAANAAQKKKAEKAAREAAEQAAEAKRLADEAAAKAAAEEEARRLAEEEQRKAEELLEAERKRQEEEARIAQEKEAAQQKRLEEEKARAEEQRLKEEREAKEAIRQAAAEEEARKMAMKRKSQRMSKQLKHAQIYATQKFGVVKFQEANVFRKKLTSRYFVLNKPSQQILVFASVKDYNNNPVGAKYVIDLRPIKGVRWSAMKIEDGGPKLPFAVRLVHPAVKPIVFALTSQADVDDWIEHIRATINGIYQTFDAGEDDEDNDLLAAELMEQLSKIERLFQLGKLKENEYNEHMKKLGDAFSGTTPEFQLAVYNTSMAGKQVICRSCNTINNTVNGLDCMKCGLKLDVVDLIQGNDQSDGGESVTLMVIPKKAVKLLTISSKKGSLTMHSNGAGNVEVFGKDLTTRFNYIITWEPKGGDKDRWEVAYTARDIGRFHLNFDESKKFAKLPTFPTGIINLADIINPGGITDPSEHLSPKLTKKAVKAFNKYFKAFKNLDGDVMLAHEGFDSLFGISENTFEITVQMPLVDDIDIEEPLSATEMSAAIEIVDHLSTIVRGGANIAEDHHRLHGFLEELHLLKKRVALSKEVPELKKDAEDLENKYINLLVLVQDIQYTNALK